MKTDLNIRHSAIAGRDMDTDMLIAKGLTLLIRQELSWAMRACTRNGDPAEIEHHMREATQVMQLRRQING